MSKQPPPAPTASTEGPCPTLIQISMTPRHWKFAQHHRTTRPPPFIRSKIDYGCQAYNSASKYQLKRVERIQNAALRLATGAYKGTPALSLNVECNMPPLEFRRQEMQLKYWARSYPLGENLPINKLTQNLVIYEIRSEKLNGRIPYAINVQDLLNKYQMSNLSIQEPFLPEKYAIKSITPKSVLAATVTKNRTVRN